ncbi:MAG: hypothetical protein HY681_08830 [Chloroflexi bacterium]|nr:hypothetical protein [Chloroflexota bacterium]
MYDFVWDYLLLSFLSSFGVLLYVTARSRLRGLYVMGRKLAQFLGMSLVIAAILWFFATEQRNIPDTLAGLDGNQQFALFSAGAASALVVLLLLSSLRNRTMEYRRSLHNLGALRYNSYVRMVATEVGSRWKSKSLSKQTRRPSSG